MRVRAALLALACAAWGGAASQQEHVSQSTHSDSREKRQALLNPGAGSGCADWSLLNYLLYYYLIQAQTTDAAQIQHQQTDQMAAALLKLRRARGTDPLPTLLSQPAGQAAIITLLQKVTQGDTGQLLLLLADIRDQGRAAALGAAQGLRQGQGGVGPGLGLAPGSLGQQRPVFGSGPQQPVPGQFPTAQQLGAQLDPLAGAGQPGLTGRKAGDLQGIFGLNGVGAEASGPKAQAQISQAESKAQATVPVTKPPPSSTPTPPPPPPPPTRKPTTTPRPRPPPPPRAPQPRPAAVRSSVLAPSTSLHVTTSTLVTTILLKKTKTVPAVRGDTPTTVKHVHTVTHVLTATGLQTDTIVITPTLVISAGTTRTVYGGGPTPGAGTGRRRRRRAGSASPLQPSALVDGRANHADHSDYRTPLLPAPSLAQL
ncbi:myc-associated zinc finger protein-like [Amphibalanus amphitrite]|uniref:myc-associated zinc finger protein-like n=1 Tax=Amphibalanus amphitrite TaxID=1232801 RepID=UPI001C9265F9|nr:myc-associated zinc finger protein-like [Amphibalanus amphitrite]